MVISERSTGSVSTLVILATSGAFLKKKLTPKEKELSDLLVISETPGHWRADALVLDRDLLDRIVDGGVLSAKELDLIIDWTGWAFNLPDAIEWWNNLSHVALGDLLERYHDEADVARRVEELAVLEGEVWAALAKSRPHQFKDLVVGFEGKDSEPTSRELAKRYRLFTRQMEALILEVYPKLRREALFDPQPAWAHRAA